ncbi:hypothetical protein CK203_093416 [Vitis vinifera]|uniref:Uncharacterized protein n=1 Tax=Vitis vinifera TaxID=29760 RepID=A0A438EX87_VITVI|nr:hypothetical protein CK203_093416 [Vitis vinifera]
MDPWKLLESTEVVLFEDKSLVEELRELRKLRTAVMVEKCLGQNDVVTCPKPRRQQIRQCGGHIDAKVGAELSDIITSKASPPYYSVSPPIRAGNPLFKMPDSCSSGAHKELFMGPRQKVSIELLIALKGPEASQQWPETLFCSILGH